VVIISFKIPRELKYYLSLYERKGFLYSSESRTVPTAPMFNRIYRPTEIPDTTAPSIELIKKETMIANIIVEVIANAIFLFDL
jgi:hypothetical protein